MALKDYLEHLKKNISEVDLNHFLTNQSQWHTVIDVRETSEWDQGIIPQAHCVARGVLEMKIEQLCPVKSQKILLVCARGNRSALSTKSLSDMGYTAVTSLKGGMQAWYQAGLPVTTTKSHYSLQRYSRQMSLPQIGEAGQKKLQQARVAIVGVGGLGHVCATFLAGAGVSHLTLIDGDVVDETNLHRQTSYNQAQVGLPKVYCLKEKLMALNPQVQVVALAQNLDASNMQEFLQSADVLLQGSDQFALRYLINQYSVVNKKPWLDASVLQWHGQLTFFSGLPEDPCYACLYPEVTTETQTCESAGVLGTVPAVMGVLQANEVIKWILKTEPTIVGKLICFDALQTRFTEHNYQKNSHCPVCSHSPLAVRKKQVE